MKTYLNLVILLIIGIVFRLIEVKLTDNIDNINIFLFIHYFCNIINIVYIYNNFLSKNDKKDIFSEKYMYIWYYCIIVSIFEYLTYEIYINYEKEIGISKYEMFTQSINLILMIILSNYLFENNKLTINNIISIIIIIIGIYLYYK